MLLYTVHVLYTANNPTNTWKQEWDNGGYNDFVKNSKFLLSYIYILWKYINLRVFTQSAASKSLPVSRKDGIPYLSQV